MEVADSEACFRGGKLLSRWAQKGLRSMHGTGEHEREATFHFTSFPAFQDVVRSQ